VNSHLKKLLSFYTFVRIICFNTIVQKSQEFLVFQNNFTMFLGLGFKIVFVRLTNLAYSLLVFLVLKTLKYWQPTTMSQGLSFKKHFALQKLFSFDQSYSWKTAPPILPIVYVKSKKRERGKSKKERGGESPCVKDTTKTISDSSKLIFCMPISFLKSKAFYQRYLDYCS